MKFQINKKLLLSAVLAVGGFMASESAVACDPAQGSGQCTWDGIHHGGNPYPIYSSGYGSYSGDISGYTPPPTKYDEDCKKQSNGNQICKAYQNNRLTQIRELDQNGESISIQHYGADGKIFKEMLFTDGNLRVSRFYGMTTTEELFAENGRPTATKEYKDGKLIKLSTYDANGYLAHSQEYNAQGQKHGEEVEYKVRRKESVPKNIYIWENGVKIK